VTHDLLSVRNQVRRKLERNLLGKLVHILLSCTGVFLTCLVCCTWFRVKRWCEDNEFWSLVRRIIFHITYQPISMWWTAEEHVCFSWHLLLTTFIAPNYICDMCDVLLHGWMIPTDVHSTVCMDCLQWHSRHMYKHSYAVEAVGCLSACYQTCLCYSHIAM